MKNLEIYEKFRTVPEEAKKEITAGRLKGFTDINPMWRIKQLTEQFGVCGFGWYPEITEQKIIEGSEGQKAAFVTINLFVKVDGEWSKPIIGVGGSSFVANERNGLYTSDECFKMAYTDALGIACKSLGMGADVYFAKDRTKYDQEQQQPKGSIQVPPVKPAPQPTQAQQLTADQLKLQNDWNSKKGQIETEIKACTDVLMVQITADNYPEFAKVTSFKKIVADQILLLSTHK